MQIYNTSTSVWYSIKRYFISSHFFKDLRACCNNVCSNQLTRVFLKINCCLFDHISVLQIAKMMWERRPKNSLSDMTISPFLELALNALSPQRSEKKMVKRNRSSRKLVKSSAKIELITIRKKLYFLVRYTFTSNHNIYKSSHGALFLGFRPINWKI